MNDPAANSGAGTSNDRSGSAAGAPFTGSLRSLLEATGVGLWDWHLPSGEVIYSRQWEAIAGYEENELPQIIDTWDSLVLPKDHEIASAIIDEYLAGKRDLYEAEFRMRRKDGSIIWAQDRGIITEWDEHGKPVRLVGILQDVTRIKQADMALKEKSEQLDFIARLSGLASWEWFLNEDRIAYSDDYLSLMGYTQADITGSFEEWDNFIHPDDLAGTNAALQAYLNGETDMYQKEVRMRRKDGAYVWTLDTGRIVEWDGDGNPVRVLGGHLNIDAIKQSEAQLQIAPKENEKYSERLKAEVEEAVKSLEDSRRINEAMFESNPYVNLIFDDHMKLFDCNPAAIAYFGYSSKEEVLEKLVAEVVSSIPATQPDGRPSIPMAERMRYTVEHGFCEFEMELVLRGVPTPMRVTMKRIPYKNSFAVVIYQVDLRQIKAAERELLRQDKMLRATNEMAALLMAANYEGTPNDVLEQALERIGRSVDVQYVGLWQNNATDGMMHNKLMSQWSIDGKTPYKNKHLDAMPYDQYVAIWPKSDGEGPLLNGPIASLDPHIIQSIRYDGVVSTLLIPIFLHGDIWGSLRLDDRVQSRSFSRVEQDIIKSGALMMASAILRQEMMENLIASREIAINSTRAKSEFLSRMSHEIRTPMNAIIGMTTIAKRVDDPEKFQYCLEKIEDASQQLLGIINDVLDMSKIEANKFEISTAPFDFEKMMQKVFNVIQVKIDEKQQQFSFTFDSPFTRMVVSDELRLSQVMINLLSNAVKFTPDYGRIALNVRKIPRDGNHFVLNVEVSDTGIGITDEQKSRLFRSFEQADGGITRKYGGTGLGLSICKKIVNLMGGDITVTSAPGEGSTFTFDVEMEWGEPLSSERARALRRDLRILVVDDAEDVRLYFSNVLAGFSIDCDTAQSGQNAIEMVRRRLADDAPYDLVFLDWIMPGMNGADTARQILRIMKDNIIVVMISVADWSQIENEAASIGITRFLPKPVLPSVMFNTILELTDKTFFSIGDAPGEASYNWPDRHILVVEDIEINREILLTILEDTQVRIDTAVNGFEAVERFKENPDRYDLILMDVQMPELDGLGATRRIRMSGARRAGDIPILAMTANAFKEDVHACHAAGMNDHVAKPIDVENLMEKLSEYLNR